MGETNSPSVAHVGYDISQLSRVKLKILTTRHQYTFIFLFNIDFHSFLVMGLSNRSEFFFRTAQELEY
jgi:hypothetical protein